MSRGSGRRSGRSGAGIAVSLFIPPPVPPVPELPELPELPVPVVPELELPVSRGEDVCCGAVQERRVSAGGTVVITHFHAVGCPGSGARTAPPAEVSP